MDQTKTILLIIGGGVAAYKALELIRLAARKGIKTRAILTPAGAQFVTPLSVGGLTGEKTFTDLFDLTDEAEMGHIELSRSADLIVAAPATADLMAKAANGLANDLASTALLATDKPVLFAPAMNVRMWTHKATQRNVETLKNDGAMFVGPREGSMACGEFGMGRLAEPEDILDTIEAFFDQSGDKPLSGKHIIVTAGPTQEPIDPVRYIANRSSGKQGYAITEALLKHGARVTLVTGPTSIKAPAGAEVAKVETALQMHDACQAALPADAAICAAAVADYRPEHSTSGKIKKERGGLSQIGLVENPDILATLSQPGPQRPKLVIGFSAETDHILDYAEAKRARKGCDWIIANDVSPESGVMGGDDNTIHLITEDDCDSWPSMSKSEVADKLAQRIARTLDEGANDAPANP